MRLLKGWDKYLIENAKKSKVLPQIAKKYRVSVKNIQKWNKLNSTTIRIGQKLRICK